MDQSWNRCLAAGTLALALGVGGSLATEGAPACRAATARAAPLFSYFSRAPRAPSAVAGRLTRSLLRALLS